MKKDLHHLLVDFDHGRFDACFTKINIRVLPDMPIQQISCCVCLLKYISRQVITL